MIRPTTGTTNTGMDVGRSPKRRKLSASTGLANVHQAAQQAGQVNGWQSTFTPNGAAKAGPVNGWQSTFTPNGAAKAGPVNGWQSTPNRVTTQPATATAASSSTSLPSLRPKLNAAKGTPSIHYMKSALKSASAIPLLDDIATQAPRPLSLNRNTGNGNANGLLSPGPTTPQSAAPIVIDSDPGEDGEEMVIEPSTRTITLDKGTGEMEPVAANVNTTDDALLQQRNKETYERLWGLFTKTVVTPGHNRDNPVPTQQSPPPVLAPETRPTDVAMEVDEVNDSMVSQLPERLSTPRKARQSPTPPLAPQSAPSPATRSVPSPTPRSAPSPVPQPAPSPVPQPAPSPAPVFNAQLNNVHTGSDREKEDHLLIFLKEVKRLMWRDITVEFAKDIPGRTYVKLQSHYSTNINKRDRTQDPPTLNLPPRFAAEATIDWATVHANTAGPRNAGPKNAGPRVHKEVADLGATAVRKRGRPPAVQNARDDDSSGSDSGIRRQRTRRAPPVNYTWPKLRTTEGEYEDWVDEEDARFGYAQNAPGPMRSESPTDNTSVPAVPKNPTPPRPATDFCSLDAQLGLAMQKGIHNAKQEHIPYLSSRHRSAMRNNPAQWTWQRENVENWQGAALHVDFSPAELQIVEEVIVKSIPSGRQSRHSTYRRHLRAVLKSLSAPKRQMLAYNISRHVQSRNLQSISSFVEDAAAGTISDVPRIQRLAVTKAHSTFSSVQKLPVPNSSITRTRELGLQSRRGWQTASTAVSYQIKNQLIDTLGPKSTWTGASSDIHTVAWSPDGQCFAAGAVAVTDPDSMQYNRPNVLLYGNTISGNIHELGLHSVVREKTSAGPNSTHAMHITQDPKIYTTVSSVAFAPSGNLMYSAGYDGHVNIWDVTKGSEQPDLAHLLRHTEKVQILAVNPAYDGNIATATTRTTGKSVKLLFFEEDKVQTPNWELTVSNFASSKAVARPDLNMSVNALKYDPTGRFLLAGFGANARSDQSFDTSGDICLWDVETQELLKVHGSSRNVFDVTFNPTMRYHGIFAVGCVANGNVNRGTRSVVRFHDLKVTGSDAKYSSRIELECKALDMNDIVWW
jgi:WD40 repeat protein